MIFPPGVECGLPLLVGACAPAVGLCDMAHPTCDPQQISLLHLPLAGVVRSRPAPPPVCLQPQSNNIRVASLPGLWNRVRREQCRGVREYRATD